MSDHKPVAIAMIVGSLALTANGAAAFTAMSVTTRPEAIGFGVAGLIASFIGLITTAVWARRRDDTRDAAPVRPIFTPWTAREEAEEEDEAFASAPLEEALLAAEEESHRAFLAEGFDAPSVPAPIPAADDKIVNMRDWVRAHRRPVPQRQIGNF